MVDNYVVDRAVPEEYPLLAVGGVSRTNRRVL